jgi:carboxylesterase type B
MKPYTWQSFLSLLFGLVQAQSSSSSLDVSLTSGNFRGVVTGNGTEKWLGIPYATPPVGSLRFKAPTAIAKPTNNTVKLASAFGNACPQPAQGLGAPISEDCLFLNVWRPKNTTANAKLPVLVWIHGGAYTSGAASMPQYDPTRIMTRSIDLGKPIVFVSINYRVNTFGFLASSLVAPEDLDAGLLDQRLAFEFIQDNVAAFGGDPTKVTIWGQSAGAGSVEAHFVYPSNRTLFRAGIADSSVGPFKSSPPASTYDKPGLRFSLLLEATGCTFGPEAISCLQNVPFEVYARMSGGDAQELRFFSVIILDFTGHQ